MMEGRCRRALCQGGKECEGGWRSTKLVQQQHRWRKLQQPRQVVLQR
jgi:hypothetical protein